MGWLNLLLILVSVSMAIQDLKTYSLYGFYFPILITLGILRRIFFHHESLLAIAESIAINTLFLGTQWIFLSLYFSMKGNQWVWVGNSLLGLGDIFFLLSLGCMFTPLNFLSFYVLSLLVSILLFYWFLSPRPKDSQKVPLAGLQALCLVALLLAFSLRPDLETGLENILPQCLTP